MTLKNVKCPHCKGYFTVKINEATRKKKKLEITFSQIVFLFAILFILYQLYSPH